MGSELQRPFEPKDRVTLYDFPNLQGRGLPLTQDCPRLLEPRRSFRRRTAYDPAAQGPVRCHSVRVSRGAWLGYAMEEFSGPAGLWDGVSGGEHRHAGNWGGFPTVVASVRRLRRDLACPPLLQLCSEPGGRGRSVDLRVDVPDLATLTSREEPSDGVDPRSAPTLGRVASMRVCGGVWVVYRDPNYRGPHRVLEGRGCLDVCGPAPASVRRVAFTPVGDSPSPNLETDPSPKPGQSQFGEQSSDGATTPTCIPCVTVQGSSL
ncbi:unnamed protein product [Lampetra planeri]